MVRRDFLSWEVTASLFCLWSLKKLTAFMRIKGENFRCWDDISGKKTHIKHLSLNRLYLCSIGIYSFMYSFFTHQIRMGYYLDTKHCARHRDTEMTGCPPALPSEGTLSSPGQAGQTVSENNSVWESGGRSEWCRPRWGCRGEGAPPCRVLESSWRMTWAAHHLASELERELDNSWKAWE